MALILVLAPILVLLLTKFSYATALDGRKLTDMELTARMDPVTDQFNRRHIVSLLTAALQPLHCVNPNRIA